MRNECLRRIDDLGILMMSRKKQFNVSRRERDVVLSLSCVYQLKMTVTLLPSHMLLWVPDCCIVNNCSCTVIFIKIDIFNLSLFGQYCSDWFENYKRCFYKLFLNYRAQNVSAFYSGLFFDDKFVDIYKFC